MMLRCAQMHREYFPVGSSSSSKVYRVKMFRPNQLPECDCVAFKVKRNKNANAIGGGYTGAGSGLANTTAAWCKHLQQVKDITCDWEQPPGSQAQLQCPKCGGFVVDTAQPLLGPGLGRVHQPPTTSIPTATVARTPRKAAAKKVAPPDPTAIIAIMRDLAKDSTPASSAPTEVKDDPVAKLKAITAKKAAKKVDASDAAAELAKLLDNA